MTKKITMKTRYIGPTDDAKGKPDCAKCNALCCRYINVAIDAPRSAEDFDEIRWLVSHEHIEIEKDGSDWSMTVRTDCEHLLEDRRCGIYETRPNICKEYAGNGFCDQTGVVAPPQVFKNLNDWDTYIQQRLSRKNRKKIGTRKESDNEIK